MNKQSIVSAAQHTPGPWRRGSDDLRSPELFCEVYAPNGYLIARCNVGTARGKEGREATEAARVNAQLIATAPELLDFVKEFLDSSEDGEGGSGTNVRHARALYAKATGAAS